MKLRIQSNKRFIARTSVLESICYKRSTQEEVIAMLEQFAAKDFNKDAYLLASLSSLIGCAFISLSSFKVSNLTWILYKFISTKTWDFNSVEKELKSHSLGNSLQLWVFPLPSSRLHPNFQKTGGALPYCSGEHPNGIQKVSGSIPLISAKSGNRKILGLFLCFNAVSTPPCLWKNGGLGGIRNYKTTIRSKTVCFTKVFDL